MDERDSSPQTILVILLGASQWPEFPDFHGSQAFAQVSAAFSRYLLDPQQFGLPSKNFLNLFDTDLSPDKIDKEIRHFLDRRATEMKQVGHGPTDLLFYFVGHGGFVGRNSEYYLAVRCTSSANPAVSGIRMEPLATTITDRARYLRRLIILDCCYSAAAFTFFQAEGPAQVAIRQTVDLFKDKAKTVGKGTALLCSSGKKVPSLLTTSEDSTIFSRALLHVLSTSGNPYRPDEAYLSLREVADLTEEVLNSLLDEKAPRPELHSPDQVNGDVADVPFFPNPLMRSEESVEKPPSTRQQHRPTWLRDKALAHGTAHHRQNSHLSRTILLIGLALLLIASGLGLFYVIAAKQAKTATATATAQAYATATATVIAANSNPYGGGTLVLNDPLSRPLNWGIESDSSFGGACQFTKGAYHVSESKPNQFNYCTEGSDFSNFTFEVQMTISKGDCGGVVFREGFGGKFYFFRVCQDGSYALFLYVEPTGINAKNLRYIFSSAINIGLSASNVIAVVANGSTLDLYVNNQKIDSIIDSTYSHGAIGLVAYDWHNHPTEVIFQNAKVWTL